MIRIDQNKVLKYVNANENLKNIFSFYLDNCITLNNPYHNTNHTLSMMYHMCCIYEESKKDDYEFKIDEQGLYILLVSAIFHDYNHSAGLYKDEVNVSIACREMEDYFSRTYKHDSDMIEKLKSIINDVIWATCYPYIIEDENLNLYQRIIRECDILVCFSDDFLTQTLLGLKNEMRLKDWNEFLGNETKFLLSSWKELKLNYSKNIINEHSESLLNIIENLLTIFKK